MRVATRMDEEEGNSLDEITFDTAAAGGVPASPYHRTTVLPSAPVTHATAASSRGDNVPSLFLRPSPRTLFAEGKCIA